MSAARQNTSNHVKRGARGKWLPGASPNPGGRPKVVADIRDLARQYSDKAIATLVEIAERGKQENARVAASTALLDRGWGKPTQPLAGDDDMPPIGIVDREAETARKRKEAQAMIATSFREVASEGAPS